MRLLSIGSTAFALVFAWLLANAIVNPLHGITQWHPTSTYPVMALVVVLCLGLTRLLPRVVRPLEERPVVRRIALGLLLIGVFAFQVRIGIAVRVPSGFDPQSIEDGAALMVDQGYTVAESFGWLKFYTNNSLITATVVHLFTFIDRLGWTDRDLALVVLNSLALSASVALTYLTGRRLGGPTVGYLAALLSLVFVGVSPWIGVVYTDTLGMLFPILIAWLLAVARDCFTWLSHTIVWFLVGIVAHVGYAMKPNTIFAVFAGVLVVVLTARFADGLRTLALQGAAGLAVLIVGWLFGGLAVQGVVAAADVDLPPEMQGARFPISHYLMTGAQTQGPAYFNDYYGVYLQEDVNFTATQPLDEVFDNDLEVYFQREMGPWGYAVFLNHKLNFTFGDGTFFVYGDGGMGANPPAYARTTPADQAIQRYLNINEDRFAWTVAMWQGTWFAVLLLATVPLLTRARKTLSTPGATHLRLALLMLALFLAFWETRARMIYLYVPYFVLLAALSSVAVAAWFVGKGEDRRVADSELSASETAQQPEIHA